MAGTLVHIRVRPMNQAHIETCGRNCHAASTKIADRHHFCPDFPSPEVAIQLTQFLHANLHVFSIVAEADDGTIGANYLWEYDEIPEVGPITVIPRVNSQGLGRRLMEAVIEHGK